MSERLFHCPDSRTHTVFVQFHPELETLLPLQRVTPLRAGKPPPLTRVSLLFYTIGVAVLTGDVLKLFFELIDLCLYI